MFTYHYLTSLDRRHGCTMGAAYLEQSMELSVSVVKSMSEPGPIFFLFWFMSCLV